MPNPQKRLQLLLLLTAIGLVIIGGSFFGAERIGLSMATWLALVSLPLVCTYRPNTRMPSLTSLGMLAIALIGLLKLSPLYFLAVIPLLMAGITVFMGQQGLLPYLMLGFSSLAFSYISKVFGFPLRLWLTEIVVKAMQWVGFEMEALGNTIRWRGHDFVVDEACMGLHLMEVGMVLSLAMVGYQVQQSKKHIGAWWAIGFSFIALLLLLFTNLSRIAGVVLLQSPPETLGHELIGLFSLGLYTLLPISLLAYWLQRYWPAHEVSKSKPSGEGSPIKMLTGINIYALMLVGTAWWAMQSDEGFRQAPKLSLEVRADKEVEEVQPNIWKLSDEHSLVYVKSWLKSYKSEHSPMICWQGSGYQLQKIYTDSLYGKSIYRGKLVKEEVTLYTACWYASKQHQTIEQLDWRWRSLIHQEQYHLVNITCATEADLWKEAKKWMPK